MKKTTVAGCAMWITGLILFITGLNLAGKAKEWLTVAGSVCFLVGLGILGIVWAKKKTDEKK